MKIFNFIPGTLNKTLETTNVRPQEAAGQKPGLDFASALEKASGKAQSGGPGSAVSLENRRAMQVPSQGDLGAAGRLLTLLKSDIKAASPEMLSNVHSLEGLIYVYNKAPV